MIIGITGSIGSGKTAAAKIFSKYHFNRVDADKISHELMKKDKKLKNKLIKSFGKEILDKNDGIDRKKLGSLVFNNEKKLKKLNSIMHPSIIDEIKNQINDIQRKCGSDAKIIIDAPLLLETGADKLVDKIIVVKAFHGDVVERNKKFSMEQLEKISMKQMALDKKLKKADFIIHNTKDLKYLEKQIIDILRKIV